MIKTILIKICVVFVVLYCKEFCSTFEFKKNCLFSSNGAHSQWSVSDKRLELQFFVPPNWNSVEYDEYLKMEVTLNNILLILEPPYNRSIDEASTNITTIPTDNLKIGWNTLYLIYNGSTGILRTEDEVGRVWMEINFTNWENGEADVKAKGLNVLIDCEQDYRIYHIKENQRLRIPVVLKKNSTLITFYSKSKDYNANISLGSKELEICRSVNGAVSIITKCKDYDHYYETLHCNKDYYIYIYRSYFYVEDYFKLGDYIFSYIQMNTESSFFLRVGSSTVHAFFEDILFEKSRTLTPKNYSTTNFELGFFVSVVLFTISLVGAIMFLFAFRRERIKKRRMELIAAKEKEQLYTRNHIDVAFDGYELKNSLYEDFDTRKQQESLDYNPNMGTEEDYENFETTYEMPNNLYVPMETRLS